jgi:hypothetical protein
MRCLVRTDRHLNGPALPLFGTVYPLKTPINSVAYIYVSPARRSVFDASEQRSGASKPLSFCSRNFESVSDCFRPTSLMSERDVPGPQRRGRRKIQASVQDLPILVERIAIPDRASADAGSVLHLAPSHPPGSLNRANAKGLLWRPASLGEYQAA